MVAGLSDPAVPGIVGDLAAAGFSDAVEVGRGGFGVVYRCLQVGLGRSVAVKVLTAELDDNRARFMREQMAMGQLTGHPNIVSVLQVGEITGGQPFLVMQYCTRGSVQDRISESGRLGLDEVLRMGVKIAAGLVSAHRLGIVHRDVKPANILITDYGEPALCDFGIARTDGVGFTTASGLFLGSPAFTAPEIISSDPPSPASDVYGLGATLYCALTGRAAFERRDGEELVAQFARIAAGALPDLREQGVPDDVAAVVEAAMARHPDDRPAAHQFGEMLQQVQAGHRLPVDAMALRDGATSAEVTPAPQRVGVSTAVAPAGRGPVPAPRAEYKQVTVLSAALVDSMDLAEAVGVERLREIMFALVDTATEVIQRCGGTVEKFTGDGLMAVFGAPVSLEDHAFLACAAALGIIDDAAVMAREVQAADGVGVALRIGLHSGEVIAGEIGSDGLGYTTVGTTAAMAQRMESAAPPGAVMLSETTTRLVEHTVLLDDPQPVHVGGATKPVRARRLRAVAAPGVPAGQQSTLIGRELEVLTIASLLDRAVGRRGGVINLVGPAGIGKTRVAFEAIQLAKRLGVETFYSHCEAHTKDVPFSAVVRLLRVIGGLNDLDAKTARARVRTQVPPDADPEDLLLLDDLLGIADPDVVPPGIDPDARRRRLTALLNATQLARTQPALFILEDAHWIDEVSESMLAEILTVIPPTPSLVINTYRPEYRGTLRHQHGAQTLVLEPLTDEETAALIDELLGGDASVRALGAVIADRAGGNPLFVEEIVRELADRDVLQGPRGAYVCHRQTTDVRVPPTVQSAIAARIDRLSAAAKQTLWAASVIGMRFGPDLLRLLGMEPAIDELVATELIYQIQFTGTIHYAFRHPLIRAVAYETQLKTDRTAMHRRLAATMETSRPEMVDANAALIADHFEAAGDRQAAYNWHMRAGGWATNRDINAARLSWERAKSIADNIPAEQPNQLAMRIAPRVMLCGTGVRVRAPVAGAAFDEVRELCSAAGDKASLAICMAAVVGEHVWNGRVRAASPLLSECYALIESVGDPTLALGMSFVMISTKIQNGDFREVERWSQTAIDQAGGDPLKGNITFGSPLAFALAGRGQGRYALGHAGWQEDFAQAVQIARAADERTHGILSLYTHGSTIAAGVVAADDVAMRAVDEALRVAERLNDTYAIGVAREAMGLTLVHRDSPTERQRGVRLLTDVVAMAEQGWASLSERPIGQIYIARERARRGDVEGALRIMRTAVEVMFEAGQSLCWGIPAVAVLVQTLLERGTEADVREATAATDRLGAEPGADIALCDITLLRLRALQARARDQATAYADYRDRYRDMATSLGFQGHIQWAKAMP